MTDFTGRWEDKKPSKPRVHGIFEDKGAKKPAVQLKEEIQRSPTPQPGSGSKNPLRDGPPVAW